MTVAARLAATVVVLRESDGPPEVLLVRRSRGAAFMADAFVFPGGRVDDSDRVAGESDPLAPFRAAAARELREEASVHVEVPALVPLARWITPSAEPKRFDTMFFVTVVGRTTQGKVDDAEVTELLWAPAREVVARHERGGLKLPPPTLRTLVELSAFQRVDEILLWAIARPLDPILPKLVSDGGGLAILLPWDPRYDSEAGDGAPIASTSPLAGGASRYVLRDGRFWGK